MSGKSGQDPRSRFTGLAELYSRCRPSYPDAAIEFLITHCNLGPTSLVVDIGCGTGISSRPLAAKGVPVLGIDPNPEMLAQAKNDTSLENLAHVQYQSGQAEATGLDDWLAALVLAAQAFHWFEANRALTEFHRILRPGGWVALLWNERDERDSFTADYGAVIRSCPETAAVEVPRHGAGQPLLQSPLFSDARRLIFANEQQMSEEALLGRAFSASYAPRDPKDAEEFAHALRAVFSRYQQQGHVTLRYETSLYLARKEE